MSDKVEYIEQMRDYAIENLLTAYENACFQLCHKDTKANQKRLSTIRAEVKRCIIGGIQIDI